MNRQALDYYGEMPDEMKAYLRHNGCHFNKKACEMAVAMMKKKGTSGKMEKIEPYSKEQVDELLKKNGVELENAIGYDHVYVANMVKADRWKSSVEDERHLALAIKDEIDDPDQADGFIMRRWYSDMVGAGIPVMWDDIL